MVCHRIFSLDIITLIPTSRIRLTWVSHGHIVEKCFFAFILLPFGLSSACFCFTKLLRPLLHRWRLLNFSCFWYLDDGISGHPNIVSASEAILIHQKDLDKSGLKVNLDKSNWHPRRIGKWLGLIISAIQMVFQVPRAKIDKLKRFLGSVIINDVGAILEEMQFWLRNIDAFNGFPIRRHIATSISVYTDANDSVVIQPIKISHQSPVVFGCVCFGSSRAQIWFVYLEFCH